MLPGNEQEHSSGSSHETKNPRKFSQCQASAISLSRLRQTEPGQVLQCYNFKKFDHVWANCKQPPYCLWCGGSHLHGAPQQDK